MNPRPRFPHKWVAIVGSLLLTACQPQTPAVAPAPQPMPLFVIIGEQPYSTLIIGQQEWTTLNYHGSGGVPFSSDTSKRHYGRYYSYPEAQAIVLPTGWRLPTQADYIKLLQSQGLVVENNIVKDQPAVRKLLSTTNWRTTPGTNESGFNAPPAGYIAQGMPPQDGDIAEFWLRDNRSISIQENGGSRHLVRFYTNQNDPTVRHCVRFVKDC